MQQTGLFSCKEHYGKITILIIRLNYCNTIIWQNSLQKPEWVQHWTVFGADGINPNDGSCSIYRSSLEVLLEFWEGLIHFHSYFLCSSFFPSCLGISSLAWLQALGQLPAELHQYEPVGHLIKEHFYCPSRMKHKLSISSYTWWTPPTTSGSCPSGEVWGNAKPVFHTSPQSSCGSVPSFLLPSQAWYRPYTCWRHHTKTKQTRLTISLRTRAPRAHAQPNVNCMCVPPSSRLAALLTRCCAPQCCASAVSSCVNWKWHVGILQQP